MQPRRAALVILVLVVTLAGSARVPVRAATVLRYARTTDIFNFDPTQLAIGNYIMLNQVYNTLVRLDKDLTPKPELAVSWQFLEQGLVLRLNLRRGVVFHSGRPFVADDVVYNVRRYQDPQVGANIRPQALRIGEARRVDDYTVDLVFRAPNPAIFDLLDLLYIMDRQAADRIRTTAAGTGPFRVAERVPGTMTRLVRSDRYWKRDLPVVDQVELRVVADDPALVANLTSRAVHVIEGPQPIHLVNLEKQRFRTIMGTNVPLYYDIIMNVQHRSFRDKRVRQAVDLTIDRERFVRLFYGGRTKSAWLPPSLEAAVREAGGVNYPKRDLIHAKALLVAAGYPMGFETALMVPVGTPGAAALGQIVQSDLAKIGIRVRLELLELAQIRTRWFNSNYQMSVHTFGRANRDPSSLLGTAVVFRAQGNITLFRSDRYTELVDRGATTLDRRARAAIYRDIAQMLLDEAFVLTIAPFHTVFAHAPEVEGLDTNLEGMPILEPVRVR
ncbi:MAG: hypothetical protein HY660_15420 [Armatimonadetes bacterium]|nr:hypothetical protein [Armatimonadota bacterium]